jgi:GT2 family glycosyltransferase
MQLSVIIINYKTIGLVLDCLASIYKHRHNHLEVIVVDNNSEDGAGEILKNKYPAVIFHQMGYNAGFARANNEGIKIAKGEVVLLLNSDTIIKANYVLRALIVPAGKHTIIFKFEPAVYYTSRTISNLVNWFIVLLLVASAGYLIYRKRKKLA